MSLCSALSLLLPEYLSRTAFISALAFASVCVCVSLSHFASSFFVSLSVPGTLSHSVCLSVCLSLSLSHTHTHCISLSFSLCLISLYLACLCLCLSQVSVSLFLSGCLSVSECLTLFLPPSSCFAFPVISLGLTIFGEIFVYVAFLLVFVVVVVVVVVVLTIEVVTFRLRGGACWVCFCCRHSPI